MVPDISTRHRFDLFYTKKKNCSETLHPRLHQGVILDPLGPSDLQLQSFWLRQKSMRPYFFCIIPFKYTKHQLYMLLGKTVSNLEILLMVLGLSPPFV